MRMYLTMFTLSLAAAVAMYAADAKAGKAAYDTSCKSCHGPDGTPNPAVAKMMKVEMKDLKSSDVQSMSDGTQGRNSAHNTSSPRRLLVNDDYSQLDYSPASILGVIKPILSMPAPRAISIARATV